MTTATHARHSRSRIREPLPIGRVLRAYLLEAKFETLAALRTPGFALPFIAVPVAIYLLFGVVIAGNAGSASEFGPGIANYLFAGFAVLAVAMPGSLHRRDPRDRARRQPAEAQARAAAAARRDDRREGRSCRWASPPSR